MSADLHLYPYLNELNEPQQEAVSYCDGPSLVLAGAGSGKTRVLVYKLIHLLHLGYDPSKLMALTFTNKAAREMTRRIQELYPMQTRQMWIGTFHSIFMRILRQHADLIGYQANFSIWDTNDSRSRIKQIIKEMGLDEKVYKPNMVSSIISRAKNRLLSADGYRNTPELVQKDNRHGVGRIVDVYLRYSLDLRESNAMDYDDLLFQINVLFRNHPDVLRLWQERIDFLLIDEYQDTNFAQYMIARYLMQEKGSICVVGDDAQSIYSFRGANIANILKFEETFQGTRIFKLEQNYRSTQTIVQAADSIIKNNRGQLPKSVFSLQTKGEPIRIHEAFTPEVEASWVVQQIEDRRRREEGLTHDSFAILYRTNAQSRSLEQQFRQRGIPFRIHGGRSFYNHKEIMDVLAYLRLIVNPSDEEALRRIINYPRRGLGDTTVSRVMDVARRVGKSSLQVARSPLAYGVQVSRSTAQKLTDFALFIDELVEMSQGEGGFYDRMSRIVKRTGIPADLLLDNTDEGREAERNVQELLTSMDEYASQKLEEEGVEATLDNFIYEVALLTDEDKSEDDTPKVTLMTIHGAKGLEFPHLFIVGVEEQLFPSQMCVEEAEVEEERRLMYVAVTRAELSCTITYTRERFRNGRMDYVRPSRFVYEIPVELTTTNTAARETLARRQRQDDILRNRRQSDELPTSFHRKTNFIPDTPTGKPRVYIGRRIQGDPTTNLPPQTQIGDLSIGGRVLHKRFGEGEVLSLEGSGEKAMATINFDSGDTKKLLLRFANLEVLS